MQGKTLFWLTQVMMAGIILFSCPLIYFLPTLHTDGGLSLLTGRKCSLANVDPAC